MVVLSGWEDGVRRQCHNPSLSLDVASHPCFKFRLAALSLHHLGLGSNLFKYGPSDPIKGFRFQSVLAQRNYKQSHSTRSTITCKLDANSILLSDPVPDVFQTTTSHRQCARSRVLGLEWRRGVDGPPDCANRKSPTPQWTLQLCVFWRRRRRRGIFDLCH